VTQERKNKQQRRREEGLTNIRGGKKGEWGLKESSKEGDEQYLYGTGYTTAEKVESLKINIG